MPRQAKANAQGKAQRSASPGKRPRVASEHTPFEQTYPTIAQWVGSCGWIEMGQDDYRRSMVRALDIGGMVWEGKTKYASLDELLGDLENGLSAWLEENG